MIHSGTPIEDTVDIKDVLKRPVKKFSGNNVVLLIGNKCGIVFG
jgi:hypothetical protein